MRTVLLTVLLAALVALTGCVKFQSDVTVDATGGGTASLSLSVSKEVLAAVTELGKSGSSSMGPSMPDLDDITRERLEKRAAGHGVTITAFNRSNAGGRESLSFSATFKDLKGLSYVMNDVSSEGGGSGLGIFAAEGGNLVLRDARYDFPAEPEEEKPEAPESSPTPEQMQKQMELAGVLMAAIADLDITMKFTVPGDIVSSNAPKTEGRTSIWTVNAENMMSQQSDMSPQIVFAGKGLKITPLKSE